MSRACCSHDAPLALARWHPARKCGGRMRAKAWPLYAASTIAIACAVMFGSAVAANSAPGDGRVVLRASHPEWATAANRVSGVASTESTAVRVYLHTRDDARLRALATAVADPGNPQYHHFLSAADVRARFAPSDGAVASVRNWLSGAGLKVVDVPRNRMYVDAEGAAARVASAFGVQLGLYRVHSETLRGTDRDLSVPRRV